MKRHCSNALSVKIAIIIFILFSIPSCITIHNTMPALALTSSTIAPQYQLPMLGRLSDFNKETQTLSLIVTNQNDRKGINLTMERDERVDTVLFKGDLFDYDSYNRTPIVFELSLDDISNFKPSMEGNSVSLDFKSQKDGTFRYAGLAPILDSALPVTFTNIKVDTVANGIVQIISSNILDRKGNRAYFSAQTDPVPLLVVLIVAAVATGMTVKGNPAHISDCSQSFSMQKANCIKNGGKPLIFYNMNRCNFECRRK